MPGRPVNCQSRGLTPPILKKAARRYASIYGYLLPITYYLLSKVIWCDNHIASRDTL